MDNTLPMVVVVDDSQTSLSLYHLSLEPLPVNFMGFKSPAESLPYLRDNAPDLLFLDIVMPGVDGLTFLQQLREYPHHKTTPVIMVTSKNYAQDRAIARDLGALDFLIKPLRFDEVRDLVRKYIQLSPRDEDK